MTPIEKYRREFGDEWANQLVHLIPDHMQGAVARWVLHGIRGGSFLDAVVTGDLFRAVARADDTNIRNLPAYVHFFTWAAPSACFGSPEKADAWEAAGGYLGLNQKEMEND